MNIISHWVLFASICAFITAIVFNKINLTEHYVLWLLFPVVMFVLAIGCLMVVVSIYSPMQHKTLIELLLEGYSKYFKEILK